MGSVYGLAETAMAKFILENEAEISPKRQEKLRRKVMLVMAI